MRSALVIAGAVLLLVVVIIAWQKLRRSETAVNYVSIECPAGDVAMTLFPNHRFTLILKHWDAETNTHVGEDRLEGEWTTDGDDLVLVSGTGRLVYKPQKTTFTIGSNSVTVNGYAWVSSSRSTPFDSYDLVEQTTADAFLISAKE